MMEWSRAAVRQPYCHVAIAPPHLVTPQKTRIFQVLEHYEVNISVLVNPCNAKCVLALYPGPSAWTEGPGYEAKRRL